MHCRRSGEREREDFFFLKYLEKNYRSRSKEPFSPSRNFKMDPQNSQKFQEKKNLQKKKMDFGVYALSVNGEKVGVTVTSDSTLGDLKNALAEGGLFDPGMHDLCCEGAPPLDDEDETLLADLNIAAESTVVVHVKKEHMARCRLAEMGIQKVAWTHVCEAAEGNDIRLIELIGDAAGSVHSIISSTPAPTQNFSHSGHNLSCNFQGDRQITHERLRMTSTLATLRDTASPPTPENAELREHSPHSSTSASVHVDPMGTLRASGVTDPRGELPIYTREGGEGLDGGDGRDADWRVTAGEFTAASVAGETEGSTPVFEAAPLPLYASESFRDFYDTPPVMHLATTEDATPQSPFLEVIATTLHARSSGGVSLQDVSRSLPSSSSLSVPPQPPPPAQPIERNPEWQAWYAKPFVISAIKGYGDCLDALIRCGARINEAPCVALAVARGSTSTAIRLLLKSGADPNLSREGNPPLVQAATARSVEVTQVLLEYGADPNLASRDGLTPLFIAVASRATQLIEVLLAEGVADVNCSVHQDFPYRAEDSNTTTDFTPAYTAICKAVQLNDYEMTALLHTKGASLAVRDGSGANLLHLALKPGTVDVRIITLLLRARKELMLEVDLDQTTPLIQATKSGVCTEIIHKMMKLAFNHIAETDRAAAMQEYLMQKDGRGRTALFHSVARRKNYKGCVRRCKDTLQLFGEKYRSASMDEPDNAGETPLSRYLADVADRFEPTGEPSWFLDMASNPRLRTGGSPRVRAYAANDGVDAQPLPLRSVIPNHEVQRASTDPEEEEEEEVTYCASPTASDVSDTSAQSSDSGPSQRQYLMKSDFLSIVALVQASRDIGMLFLQPAPRGTTCSSNTYNSCLLFRLMHICSSGFRWHADRHRSSGEARSSAVDLLMVVLSEKLSEALNTEVQKRPYREVDLRGVDGITVPILAASSQDLIEKGINLSLLMRMLWKATALWGTSVPFEEFCKTELNKRDDRGRTALILAAQQLTEKHLPRLGCHRYLDYHCGHNRHLTLLFLKQILSFGADPDLKDLSGNSATSIAASARDIEVVKCLVRAGANPNTTTPMGVPLVMLDPELLGEYITLGADVNRTNAMGQNIAHCVELLCLSEPLHFIDVFVGAGGDIDAQDSHGKTLLMKCVEEYPALTSSVAPLSKNVDIRDENGTTALMKSIITTAAVSASPSSASFACSVLLKCKASVHSQDYLGNTVLHHAASSGASASHIKYLIAQGVAVNEKNVEGHTALSILISSRPCGEEIVNLLVASGADVNVVAREPLLHAALRHCPMRILNVLLNAPHIDFSLRDADNTTLLMHAVHNKRTPLSIFETILKGSAAQRTLFLRDAKGLLALHHGVSSDRVKNVELLLNALREAGGVEEMDLDVGLVKSVGSPAFLGMVGLLMEHGADMKKTTTTLGSPAKMEPFVFTLIKRFGDLPTPPSELPGADEDLMLSSTGLPSTAPRLLYSTMPTHAVHSPHLARVTRAFGDTFKNKISWSVKHSNGETCLMHALAHGIWAVPLILVSEEEQGKGEKARFTDYRATNKESGRCVLHYLAAGGGYPYVKAHGFFNIIYETYRVFSSNFTPDVRDVHGITPLMLALQHGRIAAVGSFLAKGASLNAVDDTNKPAWAYATPDCLQFLCASDFAMLAHGAHHPLSHAIKTGIDPLPIKLTKAVDVPVEVAGLAGLYSSLSAFKAVVTKERAERTNDEGDTCLIVLCKHSRGDGVQQPEGGVNGSVLRPHPTSLTMKLRYLCEVLKVNTKTVDRSGHTARHYCETNPNIPEAIKQGL